VVGLRAVSRGSGAYLGPKDQNRVDSPDIDTHLKVPIGLQYVGDEILRAMALGLNGVSVVRAGSLRQNFVGILPHPDGMRRRCAGRLILRAVVAFGHSLTESGGPSTMGIHQPDQAIFRSVLPEEIDWKPFPSSARLAILVGEPSEPGPYVIRVKVPSGIKLMPQQHPEDRVYTVVSGVFSIGLGSQFDDERLQAYPPGTVIVLPGDTPHSHWAKPGAYVTQVSAIGPLGLEYLDPIDDPRNK
jgi:hypothetical protein